MSASVKASLEGLKRVDKARCKKGWKKSERAWVDLAHTSTATLKRFWSGKAISVDAFKEICISVGIKDWKDITDLTSHSQRPDFFSYDDYWVGRKEVIEELSSNLQKKHRLLVLTGITGIGKTALGECLIERLAPWLNENWSQFKHENLDNEKHSPAFIEIANQWLEQWGSPLSNQERHNPEQVLEALINYLRDTRCLLMLDSLEWLLRGNEEEGWADFLDETWLSFFVGVLKAEKFESRIILTSQDLPYQIQEKGGNYQTLWCLHKLDGLQEEEQIQLFERMNLICAGETTNTKRLLCRIGKAYEGHPLALRVICGDILQKPYSGNVCAYWQEYGHEIQKVEEAQASSNESEVKLEVEDKKYICLDRYTQNLRRNVQYRLKRTFKRLADDFYPAYLLICTSSVFRRPYPKKYWFNQVAIYKIDMQLAESALNVLDDRYLIEKIIDEGSVKIRMHNLIRSVALQELKKLDIKSEGS